MHKATFREADETMPANQSRANTMQTKQPHTVKQDAGCAANCARCARRTRTRPSSRFHIIPSRFISNTMPRRYIAFAHSMKSAMDGALLFTVDVNSI